MTRKTRSGGSKFPYLDFTEKIQLRYPSRQILKGDARPPLRPSTPATSLKISTIFNRIQTIGMPGLPQQRQFNPYSENGGTILAIAGADFSVIAGDTRQSEGYSIQTRYAPKVFRLCVLFLDTLFSVEERFRMLTCPNFGRTDRAVLAVNGFAADGNMFVKSVKQRLEVRRQVPSCLTNR
jgi:hypothetical protein